MTTKDYLTRSDVRDLVADRLDWPTIGVGTVRNWAIAGVGGRLLEPDHIDVCNQCWYAPSEVDAFIEHLRPVARLLRKKGSKSKVRR